MSIKSILFENNIFIVVLAGKNHSIKEKNGLSYRNIKVIEVHLLSKKLWHSLSFLSSITEQNLRLKIHNLNKKNFKSIKLQCTLKQSIFIKKVLFMFNKTKCFHINLSNNTKNPSKHVLVLLVIVCHH